MKLSHEALSDSLIRLQKYLYYRYSPFGKYPSKGAIGGDEGDGGDDCLWLGLLTSVGYQPAATALLQSQAGGGEPRAGMFYRNPARRSNDNAGFGHFFSRDMGMGVLCALGSKFLDPVMAWNSAYAWAQYIDKSRPCLQKKPKWLGGGCAVRSPIYSLAPDDRSQVTPAFWALMGRVWKASGWNTPSEMSKAAGMDGDWSIVEAENCPVGYQLHLHAIESYLKLLTDQSREYQQKMADICFSRSPDDRFYKILKQRSGRQDDIDWLMDVIDNRPRILADNWLFGSSEFQNRIDTGDYCGWDLLFLGHLILKLSN